MVGNGTLSVTFSQSAHKNTLKSHNYTLMIKSVLYGVIKIMELLQLKQVTK